MPKELLIQMLHNNLYIELTAIVFLYVLNWAVILFFCFKINHITVKFEKILLGAVILSVHSLTGKQFLPQYAFGVVSTLLLILLLLYLGRLIWYKAVLTSMFVFLIMTIGASIIFYFLSSYDKTLVEYTLTTPTGILFGTLIELFVMLFYYFLYSFFKSKFPARYKKISKSEIFGAVFFIILTLFLYYLLAMSILVYKDVPKSTLTRLIFIEVLLVICFGAIFLLIRSLTQKEHKKHLEAEVTKSLLEESYQLLETLLCERREFRNKLQVINALAAKTANNSLTDYIERISKEISIENTIYNIENPILASLLVSRQIKAQENNIYISVDSKPHLTNLSVNPLKLGQIINILMDVFIENEIESKSNTRTVFISINEIDDQYEFRFENSKEATNNINQGKVLKVMSIRSEDDRISRIKLAEEKISELGGTFSRKTDGTYVVCFAFRFKK